MRKTGLSAAALLAAVVVLWGCSGSPSDPKPKPTPTPEPTPVPSAVTVRRPMADNQAICAKDCDAQGVCGIEIELQFDLDSRVPSDSKVRIQLFKEGEGTPKVDWTGEGYWGPSQFNTIRVAWRPAKPDEKYRIEVEVVGVENAKASRTIVVANCS